MKQDFGKGGRRGLLKGLPQQTFGELIVARASSARLDEVTRYTVAESAMWAHPAVAGRVVAVKDVERLIVWTIGDRR